MRRCPISSSKRDAALQERLLRARRRDTASRMNFGKFAFGALLLAIGILLLAVRLGFAHPDTPIFLLRYWPLLLIAFGLAFLAGVIKNPFLGCFAILLILGGTVLGIFWMNQHRDGTKDLVTVSTESLDKAESLSVRVRTSAGRFYIGGGTLPPKKLSVRVRTFTGASGAGYRFDKSRGEAVLEWPRRSVVLGLSPPGTSLDVRVPETLPMTLSWEGQLSSIHADLTLLRPMRCAFDAIASWILLGIKSTARPEEIRIWGLCSSVTIRIHGDCPVRLTSHGPFVMRSLSSDFDELAPGRGKDRVDAAGGRGRPVRIYVGGTFVRIKIERTPLTTVLTREESEWPQPESTASRSHSPSS